MAHSQARGSAKTVLLVLAERANDADAQAWPSVRRIAADAGISERSVSYALRKLVELGELKVEEGRGRSHTSRYTVLVDAQAVDNPVDSLVVADLNYQEIPAISAPFSSPNRDKPDTGYTVKPANLAPRTKYLKRSTPLPPASGGNGAEAHRRPHCPEHRRWRGDCLDCRRALQPPKPPRPAWCGQCEERTRILEDPTTGLPAGRCPNCHPLEVHDRAAS
jgi:hypothetical protein